MGVFKISNFDPNYKGHVTSIQFNLITYEIACKVAVHVNLCGFTKLLSYLSFDFDTKNIHFYITL